MKRETKLANDDLLHDTSSKKKVSVSKHLQQVENLNVFYTATYLLVIDGVQKKEKNSDLLAPPIRNHLILVCHPPFGRP